MTLAGRLPTTRWSLVLQAAGDEVSDSIAKASLEELCAAYWPALYGYLRRRGRTPHDAEDLVQGFFSDLLARDSIGSADATRGRFRAFLYTALDHYVANQHRRQTAVRRGGRETVLSLQGDQRQAIERDGWFETEVVDRHGDPQSLFDRQWAKCLLRQTLDGLRDEYQRRGQAEWFDRLAPLLTGAEPDTQQRSALAEELGLSRTALKVAIHRLRVRYRQRLLDAVAQTVEDPCQSGEERQWLFRALDVGRPS
ncbi:RNA polymerase sigma factor [Roseiconus nitratireducens]|nr:sigma-70 family RNA polymerase sigma factor [Roseiconus nitratireducens]